MHKADYSKQQGIIGRNFICMSSIDPYGINPLIPVLPSGDTWVTTIQILEGGYHIISCSSILLPKPSPLMPACNVFYGGQTQGLLQISDLGFPCPGINVCCLGGSTETSTSSPSGWWIKHGKRDRISVELLQYLSLCSPWLTIIPTPVTTPFYSYPLLTPAACCHSNFPMPESWPGPGHHCSMFECPPSLLFQIAMVVSPNPLGCSGNHSVTATAPGTEMHRTGL